LRRLARSISLSTWFAFSCARHKHLVLRNAPCPWRSPGAGRGAQVRWTNKGTTMRGNISISASAAAMAYPYRSPLIADTSEPLVPVGSPVRAVLASQSSPTLALRQWELALSLVGSQMPSHREQRNFRSSIESYRLLRRSAPVSPGRVPFFLFVPAGSLSPRGQAVTSWHANLSVQCVHMLQGAP
jgi:hypothetical protein